MRNVLLACFTLALALAAATLAGCRAEGVIEPTGRAPHYAAASR